MASIVPGLGAALQDRYRLESELGGMARRLVAEATTPRMSLKRPFPEVLGHFSDTSRAATKRPEGARQRDPTASESPGARMSPR